MSYVIRFLYSIGFAMICITAQAQDNQLTKKERAEGWQLLFDGKTTTGWKGAFLNKFPDKGWKVEGGILSVEPSNGKESTNGGDIVTLKEYSDFELKADFKITEGANSGIKYFVDAHQATPNSPRSAYGLEFQVLDDERHPDAKLGKNGNRTIGSLYDLIPASTTKIVKPIGQWNTARIVSKGSHVEHWLNGVKVLEYERGSAAFKALVADSKYKDIPGFGLGKSGRILLQDHGDQVFYKNIKIKELASKTTGKANKIFTAAPGVVSFTFRNSFQKNVAATLDTIKSMGLTNIEFSNLFGKTASELRRLLDERGMYCTSYGTGYSDLITNTAKVGETAKTLGASFVRVAWIPHDNKVPFPLDTAKKAVADFNKAGKLLKERYGLTFCYHNHGYEFVPYEGGTLYDYIVRHTDPRYVSFEMDILWVVHPGQNPVTLLNKYGSRYKLMHIKDLRKGVVGDFSGSTAVDNDVALGTGQIDIPAVLKAARKSAIQHYYIEDESSHVSVQVPQSIAYLNSL